jgi:cell wall-associated NlpC family hydrolase
MLLGAAMLASILSACGPRYVRYGNGRPAYTRAEGNNLRLQLVASKDVDPQQIKKVADQYLGVPYLWGGESMDGIDCSAFTQQVWKKSFELNLPRTAAQQSGLGVRVFKYGLMPGDLVFFGTAEDTIDHVGIYMGNNQFINATTSSGVKYSNLDEQFWRSKYQFAKRTIF